MGRGLYENNVVFKKSMDRMNSIGSDLTGRSILSRLYGTEPKSAPFHEISVTHPAIFMVEHALSLTVRSVGIEPTLALGCSLGSIAAAVLADCMSEADGMTLSVRQAQIIANELEQGAMIAILADQSLFKADVLSKKSVIASYNLQNHFVISTRLSDASDIEDFLRAEGHIFQRLPVSYPFHSPWIASAKSIFANATQGMAFRPAKIPIASCATAEIFHELPLDFFWTVAIQPILFRQTIGHLEASSSYRYLDLSPSGTLATFLKYLLLGHSTSSSNAVLSPYGDDVRSLASIRDIFA